MDQEQNLEELSGTVDSVIYKNEENGYTVLRLTDGSGQSHTVVGVLPYAVPGEEMILSGSWTTHSVHGRQFKAEFAQRLLPKGEDGVYHFLSGGVIKGIGSALALLIVNRFGDRALDVLENDPEALTQIRGISSRLAAQFSKDYRSQIGLRKLMEFICSFELRPVLAMRLYRYYGDKALELVQDNPYLVSTQQIGGRFSEADHLAMQLGIDGNSRVRVNAAVLFELKYNTGNGHCFIPREKLSAVTAQLIDVSVEDAEESISQLIAAGLISFEEIAGCRACYLPELYEAECNAAERFAEMSRQHYQVQKDMDALLTRLEKKQGIEYAAMQCKTLQMALQNQILVITGGPGTGKTTSIRAILALYDELKIRTLLTAPTGRAAKRMTELTGREASTVHRLLGAKFAEDGEHVAFTKTENDPLDCDAVILDECSMVDVLLMDALLRAMPPSARLILVGDQDQLPSVGPGNVFSAVIRSGVIPTVRLTEIFRQKEGSRIVRNAHLINSGEHPDLSENRGDFFRLRRIQAETSVETIADLCTRRIPNGMHIPSDQIQVLSPTRKGPLGTAALNQELQKALNPPAREKREKLFGDLVFREGDRVMQIKNNYDMMWTSEGATGTGIYNGDIGVITEIDLEAEFLLINFDGKLATYGFDNCIELEHAWAITVHKAQGSEYRAVVLALAPGSSMLMTRDVLYTAVTRARELLILVGEDNTAFQMIDNYRQTRRYNALRVRLRRLCGVE